MSYLMPIADKIKSKLASWKGSLLSIIGRVELVRSFIQGMLVYSFQNFAWPLSLIKQIDKWIINFIWSGNVEPRRVVTVAWHKVCSPTLEGGLGIRSLRSMNDSAMLKRCWELLSSDSNWAILLKSRMFKKNSFISYNISSSIWSGLRGYVSTVKDNSVWQLGNGSRINFWCDQWLSMPIVDFM